MIIPLLYIVFLFCFSLKWRHASFFICYMPMIIPLKCSTWLIASKYNFPHRPNISSLSVAGLFWKICLLEPPSKLAVPGAYHTAIIPGLRMTMPFSSFSLPWVWWLSAVLPTLGIQGHFVRALQVTWEILNCRFSFQKQIFCHSKRLHSCNDHSQLRHFQG